MTIVAGVPIPLQVVSVVPYLNPLLSEAHSDQIYSPASFSP